MPEILSPAGSPEHAVYAVKGGADALYLGMEKFSARAGAANFSVQQLRELVPYCHMRGVKVYAAVNTILFDSELEEFVQLLKELCAAGVDALITQDLAAAALVRLLCPQMELHASTQMTLHTEYGCRFAKTLGFKRVVLSRELPLEVIREISENVETEVFVHGALCMSVSGQCLMSAMIGGRSANRGMCAQPCRLPCSAQKAKSKSEYALSLKDLCLLDDLKPLETANVDSFKIEGRMKRPEYAAISADSAKKAVLGEDYDRGLLEKVFSRSGFTDGYLHSRLGKDMFGRRTAEDSAAAAKALPKIRENFRKEYKRARISFSVSVKNGEPLRVSAHDENGVSADYSGAVPQKAVNNACDEPYIRRQLSKLGDTFYELEAVECDIDGGLALPASEFNRARRELVGQLSQLRAEKNTRYVRFYDKPYLPDDTGCRRAKSFSLRINAFSAAQLECIDASDVELVWLPLGADGLQTALARFGAHKVGIAMPRFAFDEAADVRQLKNAAQMGIKHILCTNFAHIAVADELGLTAHAGMGLNTSNTLALRTLERLGAADAVISPEMKCGQINALGSGLPIGAAAYGKLPLMLCANCPAAVSKGCGKGCAVYDRTGRRFPIKCSKKRGYVELLNSDILCLSDKTGDLKNVDFFQIELFDESAQRAAQIIDMFKKGKPLDGATRGLYYRGLKGYEAES